jgi:hypothetical protein
MASFDPSGTPADLNHAGAVVDKAIEHLIGQGIDGVSIASALLGASLSMLSRSLDDANVVHVLENAIRSVRAGELRQP